MFLGSVGVDLAIHEHLIMRTRDESGALTFTCHADDPCGWFWWLAPVPAASPVILPSPGLTAAEKAVGRRTGSARRRLAATSGRTRLTVVR